MILGLLVLGIVIYWLILRPVQIRKDCHNYAAGAPIDVYEHYYKACLNKNGLNE